MHMSSMDHLILVLLSMVVAFLPRFPADFSIISDI